MSRCYKSFLVLCRSTQLRHSTGGVEDPSHLGTPASLFVVFSDGLLCLQHYDINTLLLHEVKSTGGNLMEHTGTFIWGKIDRFFSHVLTQWLPVLSDVTICLIRRDSEEIWFVIYLQGLVHASANNQQVDTLLQHLLQISRLDTWVMLAMKKQCFVCFFQHVFNLIFSSTHIGASLPPVPGFAASRPDLTVLVAGGASIHLHMAPGKTGDLRRWHVLVIPPAGRQRTNSYTEKKQQQKHVGKRPLVTHIYNHTSWSQ